MLGKKKHSVCSGGHPGDTALGKTAEVIGEAGGPDRFIGSTCEVEIFQSLACDFVNDGVGLWGGLPGIKDQDAGGGDKARSGTVCTSG